MPTLSEIEDGNLNIAAFLNFDEWKTWDALQPTGIAGSLSGLDIAIKDNIAVKGLRLSCGSKILENFVAPYSATAVQRLQAAGARIFGKTSMDEFGMGSTGLKTHFKPCKNPAALDFVPGGRHPVLQPA